MIEKRWIVVVVMVVVLVLAFGADALAKKGGGGGDAGGGIADADVSILYCEGPYHTPALDGPIWIGDDAGNVQQVSSLVVKSPSFGPAGSTRLVFVSEVEGYGIYVTDDFSGGGLRKVLDTTRNVYLEPSWSNDADTPLGEELIAFCEYDAATDAVQLFVTTLDGDRQQVTWGSARKTQPCWNPADSTQILVNSGGQVLLLDLGLDAQGTLVWTDYVDLLEGTALEGVAVANAAFAPDGSKVVLEATTGGPYDVDVYTVAHDPVTGTNTLTNLTNGALDTSYLHPCIRSDGRVMFQQPAVINRRTTLVSLWVMEADGSDIRLYGSARSRHVQGNVVARR